jgi:hypothetical protein
MQGWSFFSPGVQDPPAATAGENAPVEALTGGGGNVNVPATADVAGAPRPGPTGLEGAEAKAAAGTLTGEVAAGLQGAEAKTAAGELTARVEPKEVDIIIGSSVIVERPPDEPSEPDAAALAASAEQRPAAYRFGVRDGKIDILPEAPQPEDREFALDTYRELVAKVRELHGRLQGTNSARRVGNSIERLLIALGPGFDDLRPGVLLSRSRSLEADRAAFGDELLADIIAMMDGTAQTLRDLLASFPIVRRIEAEGLALRLDRSADAIPAIREQMYAIKAAAARSGAVTEEAISALTQNDAAIEDAIDPVVQRSLVADKLLVVRNFASAVVGGIATYGRIALAKTGTELGELAGKSWQAIKDELPKGIGATARIAPLVGLVTLSGVIAGPFASMASLVPAFRPISEALRKAVRDGLKDTLAGKEKDKAKTKRARK